jgi:hypothetical protein
VGRYHNTAWPIDADRTRRIGRGSSATSSAPARAKAESARKHAASGSAANRR